VVSQENVEVVRQTFVAAGSGDPALAGDASFDPAAEWDMSGVTGWAEKQVYRGPEIFPFLEGWASSWRGWHFDVDDVRDAGGQLVFVAIHEWATGVQSEVAVDQRRYFAVDVQQGRILRVRMFSERADALKAVGLEE
jgi:ketosteroid isomerase-like protein